MAKKGPTERGGRPGHERNLKLRIEPSCLSTPVPVPSISSATLSCGPPHPYSQQQLQQQQQQPLSASPRFASSFGSSSLLSLENGPGGGCQHQMRISSSAHQQPKPSSPLAIPHVSQPTSPVRDFQTPLTASPSFCSSETAPFLAGVSPSTALSIPEENSLSNYFFTLQKEGERRTTLMLILEQHESQIIEKWYEQILNEIGLEELLISRAALTQLLQGLRLFILPKEGAQQTNGETAQDHLQSTLTVICQNLSPRQEPSAPVHQLITALYLFPTTVQPLLKLQKIKPHWMFTLDDLIRNAVQQALRLLKPAEPVQQQIQTAEDHFQQRMMASTSQSHPAQSGINNNFAHQNQPNELEMCKSYSEQIKILCEDLIGVEKKLMNVLEAAFVERQERIRSLCASTSSDLASSSFALPAPSSQFGGGGGPATVGQHLSPLLSVDDSGIETLANDEDESLRDWLFRIGCDDHSVELLERELYTKRDLVELVTREELVKLGIRGGIACRIWRHIQRARLENSQRFNGDTVSRKHARGCYKSGI